MPTTVGSTITVEWIPSWNTDGHTVSLEVNRPDGSKFTPTVTPGDGQTFYADVEVDQPGRYILRWLDVTLDNVSTDIFDAWPEDPRYLISVDDAATGLRWRPVDKEANIGSLALYVAAATEVIEDIVGAVLIRTVVQPSDGGRTGVALWERPSSITAVSVNGSASTRHVVNLNAGIVYADKDGGRFPDGRQNIVITYRTGFEAVPPSIQLAARELVRHLWQIGQQALSGDGSPSYDPATGQMSNTRTGFAVPRRVIELCGNHYALPGIA